jgi:hypothetical protein
MGFEMNDPDLFKRRERIKRKPMKSLKLKRENFSREIKHREGFALYWRTFHELEVFTISRVSRRMECGTSRDN